MRVLIVVTHLLGAGHLTRAAALARAFGQAGHETTLISGGGPTQPANLGTIRFVQLPPVRIIGTDFKTLLDANSSPIDEAYLTERRELLLATLHEIRPDIVITELYPFGRRVLAKEFEALLTEARHLSPRPRILCSIRDILASPSKPERIAQTRERIRESYDAVLVHGDPQLVPLETTWPVDEGIRPLIRYTGYVDENPNAVVEGSRDGILVSGGSSAASLPLYRAALGAAREMPEKSWRILVGRGVAEEDFQALLRAAPSHVTVERARPDFRALLAQAEISISQAGYNTVVDLLRTGVQSVLVPFEAGQETEQRLRAERLKALGLASIVSEDGLSPTSLVEAIREAESRQTPQSVSFNLDGAQQSVAIAESLFRAAPALHQKLDWSPLDQALSHARDRGYPVQLWWRDDDAVSDTPALDRLLSLSRQANAGIALAVIPSKLEASLTERLQTEDHAFALVHGWSHTNHAPAGEKKAEFGAHRSLDLMAWEAAQALRHAQERLGDKLLPVFVPPWNRIAPGLLPRLALKGYQGISTFTDRKTAFPAPGLLQVNTHVDPIDWHGCRGLLDPARIIASLAGTVERRAAGEADPEEPIGFLTHHLVHDDVIWAFCEALMVRLAERTIPVLRRDLVFSGGNRITAVA
ncbi:glycosyltransferase [Microvirga sp. 2YAF29]|uniref:glycosyltransferase n=1 Tax=Microvirga sp. 2YAF29 TaxID=3233031 RepID=UPI003F97357F